MFRGIGVLPLKTINAKSGVLHDMPKTFVHIYIDFLGNNSSHQFK